MGSNVKPFSTSSHEHDNDIENSINDKLQAKMKELIGEKSRNGDL